jgi:hypothetical protein
LEDANGGGYLFAATPSIENSDKLPSPYSQFLWHYGRAVLAMFKVRRRGRLAPALLITALTAGSLSLALAPALPAGANVSGVTVSVAPAAAGYTRDSTYTINFIATNGINSNGTNPIGIEAPPGTSFEDAGANIIDNTNPADSIEGACEFQDNLPYIATVNDCGEGGLHIASGDSITLTVQATNPGAGNYTLSLTTDNDPNPITSAPYSIVNEGYWLVGSDGGIFSFGSAQFYGSTGSLHLQRPVVGIVATADHNGYWLDASDGGVFSYGDTSFYGSIPGLGLHPAGSGLPHSLVAPIVGMVPSADDHGYFMVASDGGVFAFGDATFAGSCYSVGGCAGAAVAVMPDSTGRGYWLVTNQGAVYAFGDAPFLGAPGNTGSAITGAVRTPDGKGYWILDADGTVHGYGDAANQSGQGVGSNDFDNGTGSAIFTDSFGDGYGVSDKYGDVETFGGVPNDGGMGNTNLNGSIIAASGF